MDKGDAGLAAQDYWSVVTRQLRKSRLGLAGLVVILLLYLVVVFAPFLAESKPIRLVHANPDDKPCRVCQDLGESWRRITLNDGRTFEGRVVRRSGDELLFEHDGRQETFDVKALGIKFEILPRQHGRRTSWPLLRALSNLDLYLLLSLAGMLVGVPTWLATRRRGSTRLRSLQVAAIPVAALLLPGVVYVAFLRTSDLHKLDKVDFRTVAKKRLGPEDSVWWPLIAHAPTDQDKRVRDNTKPSWMTLTEQDRVFLTQTGDEWEEGWKSHPLGTDDQRRDIASRMIYGTRISLSVGFFSVAIYVTIGVVLGALAGYFGSWVDAAIMRLIEIIMCFPTLFLIITMLAVVEETNLFYVMGVIAFVGWTGVARLVRGEFLKLRQQDYVQAARALGATRLRIIFRHILPNAMSPVFVSATFGIAGAILTESALSFLGIGVPLDAPTWGNVLRLARPYVTIGWWEALWPGIAIFVTMTSFNLFGESLRDAMDPRLKT